MNWLMLSFAAGSPDLEDAGARLVDQARASNHFSSCVLITDDILAEILAEIPFPYDLIQQNRKGYGLWFWKSLILKRAIEGKFGNFDGIFYADAGCELLWNMGSNRKFRRLKKRTHSQGIVAFETSNLECAYSKKAVTDFLVDKNQCLTHQVEATTILIDPNHSSVVKLIHDWWLYCSASNFNLLRDPIEGTETENFIDHRHDQSIFSVLFKNYEFSPLPESTPRYSGHSIPRIQTLIYTSWPIWCVRNRSGVSILSDWQNNGLISVCLSPLYPIRSFILRFVKLMKHLHFAFKSRTSWIPRR